MPSVSIVSTHVDAPEWAELFVKSVRRFTVGMDYEILIVDNGSLDQNLGWLKSQNDVRLVEVGKNIGHGPGMDMGTELSEGNYVCVFDIDAHVQRDGWLKELVEMYEESERIKLIGCRGPDHKPLKPPLFFYERDFILKNKLSFKHIPGVSTDTAQKVFHDITGMGYEIIRFVPYFKIYDCYGDEFWVNGKPTFYHHWYGTRFCENNPHRKKQVLDGYEFDKYLENKTKLFNQPLVKEILGR